MKNENKVIIQTTGNGDLNTLVYSLYGKEIADCLLPVDYQYDDIKITGVIGKPEIARSNKSYQIFFVNKRFVKDKTLTAGAEQAFKGLLPIGKFGFLILNLEMEPIKIDVNVHPTKLEIRFQEEQKVFKAVYHGIRDSLLKAELVRNTENPVQETKPIVSTIQKPVVVDENKAIETVKEEPQQIVKPIEAGLFSIFKKKDNTEEIKQENENVLAEIFNKKAKEHYEEIKPNNNESVSEKVEEVKTQDQPKEIPSVNSEENTTNMDFNEMYSKTFGKVIEEPKKEDVPKFENILLM